MINADGSGQTRLTDDPGFEYAMAGPSWSPDGTKIVVCEGFEGRIQIFELEEGEPESAPLISNIAHFGKHVDSYGDLILIAEPELGDVYLLRTGLDVPIELTRFGGEGDAPHQFKWINGLWIGDG